MRTPLKIMLATIVLAGLVAAPAFAAKPRTTVEILGAGTSNPKPLYFQGVVKSQKRYCEKERKVTLYRARSGKDKRVGAKRAEPDEYGGWVWEVEVSTPQLGNYYGKAEKTRKCRGDKSKKFKLDDPNWE